jgi:hypothetical protein
MCSKCLVIAVSVVFLKLEELMVPQSTDLEDLHSRTESATTETFLLLDLSKRLWNQVGWRERIGCQSLPGYRQSIVSPSTIIQTWTYIHLHLVIQKLREQIHHYGGTELENG